MAGTLDHARLPAAAHSCYESCFTQKGGQALLFQRLVIEVEMSPDGRLLPRAGAAWRPEPARAEGSIHRRLAALGDAPASRIAAFASVHGFLRRHDGGVLGPPGPVSAAVTAVAGQEAVDDTARVEEWIDAGALGPPPSGSKLTVAEVALFASLPDVYLDAFDTIIDGGAVPPPLSLADGMAIAARATLAAGPAAIPYLSDPGRIRSIDPARLRRALRISEWIGRVVGGLEAVPAELAAAGGPDAFLRQLTINVPEAYAIPQLLDGPEGPTTSRLRSLTTETLDGWRAATHDIGTHVRSIDLIHGALRDPGIGQADKRELSRLYQDLAGNRPPVGLTAADLAERVRPLLARRIESELAAIGAWPLRRGGPAGLYVRALAAAWTELAEVSVPKSCATTGCLRAVPPTRNRRYCNECQAERKVATVRRIRSGLPPDQSAG